MRSILFVFLAFVAACAVKVDYDDPSLGCEDGEDCQATDGSPPGVDAAVVSEVDASSADADPGEPDADPGPTLLVFATRIAAGSDDAEELVADPVDELVRPLGDVNLGSSDLEMALDTSDGNQLIGLRFVAVDVPQGATIDRAVLLFTADEVDDGATTLHIHGEGVDDPATFTSESGNISARLANETAAAVDWTPDPWNTVGESGEPQRVVITSIVQELVNRAGWSPGQAMVFLVGGAGQRVADTYNKNPATAPLLRISYVAE